MICYRDMTFCTFYRSCKEGSGCMRALTEKIREDAKKWWGSDESPISQFSSRPGCFKEKNNDS